MMKKATWKKLFTRNKSKTRDQNKAVCNLCVGMPLADITTLCDKHRSHRIQSGNGIPQESNSTDATVEIKKPPSILKSASPTTAAEPAVVPSIENSAPVQAGTPEKAEKVRKADESTNNKDVDESHQDGALTNEEFMTEELDSPNLSENSHTENTIVIEPLEPHKENRVIEEDGSDVKPVLSHKDSEQHQNYGGIQTADSERVVTISDLMSVQDDLDQTQPSKYRAQIGSRKAIANLVWFGTSDGPEKSSLEIKDDMNAVLPALDQEAALDEQADDETCDDESNPCEDATHDQHVMNTHQNAGSAMGQVLPSLQNPALAERTPLSTLLPNVYLKATTNPQTPVDSGHVIHEGVDDASDLGNANSESSEDLAYDPEERGDGEEYDDDRNSDEVFDEDEDGDVSSANDSADSQQADAPSTNHPESTELTSTTPASAFSSAQNRQPHYGSSPGMIFGTHTSEFSAQSLYFSPNFVVQGMNPFGSENAQNINVTGEDSQHPNSNIFVLSRVTEITEPTESNREVEESSEPYGQSPPSLEDEDELDRNSVITKGARQLKEKQLKKE